MHDVAKNSDGFKVVGEGSWRGGEGGLNNAIDSIDVFFAWLGEDIRRGNSRAHDKAKIFQPVGNRKVNPKGEGFQQAIS